MMIDSHIHTEFSEDSEMKIEHALQQSKKIGIGITLTEHVDFNFSKGTDIIFDIEKYFKNYEKYRSESLMLGIEIGMQQNCLERNREITSNHPFDYVIGSIHIVDSEDIYYPEFYIGKTKKEAFEQYFECMIENVNQYDFIDSLGHIDYISRYANYDDNEIYYHEFNEYINEVLKAIIKNKKVMEINTRRLGGKKAYDNLTSIYKAYSQIGGKYVTIGSDAHRAEDIAKNYNEAIRICEICNLKPVYFKKRKMEYISL
ncbi:histidinol phosphate phosphatase [Clostridium lacusfryxellense]|uniref:histidinol phosphate phosphatase n=1 Tax=Clostridium lacusfryxellense TaxID=205328 RepID=UPI001C0D4D62|nr:histidinol phosphate phosphatase [Clostridium lacusfryxellense]MBU3111369.1 histidinol phosphate phosphatase [Clostridium lacusfryxellense]